MAHKNVDYKPEDIQFPNQKIVQSELVHEMQSSYIEYAMSVIVGRALPDVRDFLNALSLVRPSSYMAYRMRRWTGFKPSRTSGSARPTMTDIAYSM